MRRKRDVNWQVPSDKMILEYNSSTRMTYLGELVSLMTNNSLKHIFKPFEYHLFYIKLLHNS